MFLYEERPVLLKLLGNVDIFAFMLRTFNDCLGKMQRMIVAKHSNKVDMDAEIVSACMPIDNRRACVRIKGRHERKAKRRRRSFAHDTRTIERARFSIDSVMDETMHSETV